MCNTKSLFNITLVPIIDPGGRQMSRSTLAYYIIIHSLSVQFILTFTLLHNTVSLSLDPVSTLQLSPIYDP